MTTCDKLIQKNSLFKNSLVAEMGTQGNLFEPFALFLFIFYSIIVATNTFIFDILNIFVLKS